MGFPGGLAVKNPSTIQGPQKTQAESLSWEDPLEEETVIHSSVLAWRIPWDNDPRGLQSMGSQGIGHD